MLEKNPKIRQQMDESYALDRDSFEPAYLQLVKIIQRQIADGLYRPGDRLPSEAELRNRYGISAMTVRRAINMLLDISSAIAIGMLPAIPVSRFRQVGNAAGAGAKIALVSREKRQAVQKGVRAIRYIELAAAPDFNKTFTQAISLG